MRFGSTGAESAEDEWPAHGRITASSFPQSLFSEPGSQWGLTVASLRGGQLADDITSGQSAIPTVRHQDVTVQQSIADGTSSKVHPSHTSWDPVRDTMQDGHDRSPSGHRLRCTAPNVWHTPS